jgi:hypothetical protein
VCGLLTRGAILGEPVHEDSSQAVPGATHFGHVDIALERAPRAGSGGGQAVAATGGGGLGHALRFWAANGVPGAPDMLVEQVLYQLS